MEESGERSKTAETGAKPRAQVYKLDYSVGPRVGILPSDQCSCCLRFVSRRTALAELRIRRTYITMCNECAHSIGADLVVEAIHMEESYAKNQTSKKGRDTDSSPS